MKRTLKFWTRYTWDSCRTVLLLVAVLAALIAIGAEGGDWDIFIAAIPYCLVLSASLCMVFINYSSQMLYVPLLLSMGETRRRILLGFHYYRVLIIAATVALCALVWSLFPGQISAIGLGSLPTITAVLVLPASLGSIMGTAFSRWPWVSMAVMMVLSGCMGGLGSYSAMGGFQVEQITRLANALHRLPWWLAVLAAAALALDMGFHWALLRRREVKL